MHEKKIFKGMINISLEINVEYWYMSYDISQFWNKYHWLCCFRDIGKLVNLKISVEKIEEVLNHMSS